MRALANVLLALVAVLAGCARLQGEFPGLDSRAIEVVRMPDPDAPPPPRSVAPEVADVRLAQADRTLAEVEADLGPAEAALDAALQAARGRAAGSLPWADAQLALSRLWEACQPAAAELEALSPPVPADPPGLPALAGPATRQRIERATALLARCEARAERARAQLAR